MEGSSAMGRVWNSRCPSHLADLIAHIIACMHLLLNAQMIAADL